MKRQITVLALLAMLSLAVFAQTETPTGLLKDYDGPGTRRQVVAVESLSLSSKLMGREMPYRVIIPGSYYTAKGERYPVIFLLHGLSGHFNNWTDKTKLVQYASSHGSIIVTPEGGDGWYTDSSTVPNDKYESYIVKELIPEIDKKFRTVGDREHRAIAGLSMGGYGAIKFGLKYPEIFAVVGSFSGALDVPLRPLEGTKSWPSIKNVYGDAGSETRNANDIFKLIRDSSPDKIKTLPFIYFDCGTEDFLFQSNRDFNALLFEKKVPHEYRELPGGHTWTYWDSQIQEFLRLATKRFK